MTLWKSSNIWIFFLCQHLISIAKQHTTACRTKIYMSLMWIYSLYEIQYVCKCVQDISIVELFHTLNLLASVQFCATSEEKGIHKYYIRTMKIISVVVLVGILCSLVNGKVSSSKHSIPMHSCETNIIKNNDKWYHTG